ncbi:gibberellin 20 oxidase 3-like [Neltuma alba]|uniref:gibberellin 20 oxidase 3-like n=1 Tax=Neltuma alba TaxID=207710 RepID=UPI0010A43444|nr:gibberellin 20 oxidase 3-like [Prosopis alba]
MATAKHENGAVKATENGGDSTETKKEYLNEPFIDLAEFMNGDDETRARACELVRDACMKHGLFQVTSHGVDPLLIREAYEEIDSIFGMPYEKKMVAARNRGAVKGYLGTFDENFSSKVPFKEIYSLHYSNVGSDSQVIDHFKSAYGDLLPDRTGKVYERYCEAMKELCGVVMEVIAMSLGVDRSHFKEYFKDGGGILRCSLYRPCDNSNLSIAKGPHSDPVCITILHQDQDFGLEVLMDGKWLVCQRHPEAFVVNLGDTFQALSNGKYRGCVHRAMVLKEHERRSLAYFVVPNRDKTVKPPELIFGEKEERKYPDFQWSDMFTFTQIYYTADTETLNRFIAWLPNKDSVPAAEDA